MKNSIFIFLLLHFHLVCFSQLGIQWERVASPDSSYREFAYISKAGTLLYKDKNTFEYFASYNYGDSWEKLDYPVYRLAVGFSSVSDPVFKEDNDNNIYFLGQEFKSVNNSGNFSSSSHIIYKFDKLSHEISVYFTNGFANSITDFDFLSNGDLIVVTRKDMRVLDATTKTEKFKKTVTITRGYVYLSKGYKNYVDIGGPSSTTGFQEFTDSLTFIGDKIEFPYFTKLHYSKGRFLKSGKYSDDGGKTWQTLTAFSIFDDNSNVGKNGYIFSQKDAQYVYSTDNGETSKVLFDNIRSWVTCDSSGNFIRMPLLCTENKMNQVSFDQGDTWQDIACNIQQKAYAFSVTAGINGNVIAEDQCERYLTYKKSEDDWQEGSTRFGVNVSQYIKLGLPNGKVFFNVPYNNYIINETFDDITLCNFIFTLSDQAYVKNDKLYIIESGNIHTSEDYVNIKSSKSFNNTNTSWSIPTGNNKLIQKGSYGYRILDLATNSTKSLPFVSALGVESSYDGKNIYVLTNVLVGTTNKRALIFHISTDEGNTFITDTIIHDMGTLIFRKFTVDHYGNIYILFHNRILASFNQGLTWPDITPKDARIEYLTDISVSFDHYIYVATSGVGILKTVVPDSDISKFIKVRGLRDENFNCAADPWEARPVTGVVVSSDGRQRPLDIHGEAYMYYSTDATTFSLNYNRNFSEVCEKEILVKDYHPDSTITFHVKVYQECADLTLGLSTSFLRRCFDNTYYGNVKNNGNETVENGFIYITLDSFFIFKSGNLEVVSYIHPELVLKLPDLEVGEDLRFNFLFELSCEADLGQEHCISAFVEADNDCDQPLPKNNGKECRVNVGSFDPNDKAIFVNGYKDVLYQSKEDKIEYLVRFQNTGTDTAFNVRIEDVISPVFDINTLRPVVASHEFEWEIQPGRKLVIYFPNIQLVDSFTNEPGSNGFVKFDMALDSTIQLGDTLENEAAIFFDFNEPIITNKVVTLYDFPDKTKDVNRHTIYAVPNPTNAMVDIKGDFRAQQSCLIRLYDIYGKLISAETGNTSDITVDLGYVRPGLYVIEIKTKAYRYTCKVSKI